MSVEQGVSYSNPVPARHGTVTLQQVEVSRKTAEWWHARYSLTGDDGDHKAYLRAVADLQDKRQYCTEFTQEGGIA